MIRAITTVIVAALVIGVAHAQENDEPPPGAGKNGNFHILQLWTGDEDRFMAEWAHPTPPNLTTTTRMERNQPLTQFILFSNCTPDIDGKCLLNAAIEIFQPDGEYYGDVLTFPAYDNHPAPPADLLVIAPNSIGIRIEDGELLGGYLVRMTVTDVHGGRMAVSELTLEAVEATISD